MVYSPVGSQYKGPGVLALINEMVTNGSEGLFLTKGPNSGVTNYTLIKVGI